MRDPRFETLADVLIGFSTNLQRGEHVLIDAFDIPDEMVTALIRRARVCGAYPHVSLQSNIVTRELLREAAEEQYQVMSDCELARMKLMNAYIAVRGSNNITELSDVDTKRMQLAMKLLKSVLEHRVNKTKWVVLRWPTPAMAQMANMSTEAFEEFFFRVCSLDYSKLESGMVALQQLMQITDRVQIKGPGTDLRFSIKGIQIITCEGKHNIPDGEVFTAPVRDSVEGTVRFNAPTIYQGIAFDNVELTFNRGKIVGSTANNAEKLKEILDSDEG
ncbi:MAG: aminopeptidase, partial [Verrucomicrobia bacterium]|nr:aminopeptidase [Verrucomicrobiota bacterium]